MNKEKKMINRPLKKSAEELQQWMHFKKRGHVVPHKKGKGSYKRNKKISFDF